MIDIPFDRQQLADYLCVERSALSAEISRLSKLGLIPFLLEPEILSAALG